MLPEDEDDIEDEGHNDHDPVQHFKLVVKELSAVHKDFKTHLNQEDS